MPLFAAWIIPNVIADRNRVLTVNAPSESIHLDPKKKNDGLRRRISLAFQWITMNSSSSSSSKSITKSASHHMCLRLVTKKPTDTQKEMGWYKVKETITQCFGLVEATKANCECIQQIQRYISFCHWQTVFCQIN